MTDFGPWEKLIAQSAVLEYKLMPLNEYQIVNLLGVLVRAPQTNLGDFYWETLSVLGAMVEKFEIDSTNNFGDRVNKEYVSKLYQGLVTDEHFKSCEKARGEVAALKAENAKLRRAVENLGGNL